MILEVDIGNTRVKWRFVEGDKTQASGSTRHDSEFVYAEIFSNLELRPRSVLVASVVPQAEPGLSEWCQQHWGLLPQFAQVERHRAGVTNAYSNPGEMGVDRWLAMLAAHKHSRSAALVVDAGSALTVDLLLADGQHLGGYIVPGLHLLRDTLFRDTSRVRTTAIAYDGQLSPGTSTQLAVSSGLQSMHLGLILKALDELRDRERQVHQTIKPIVCLTGGYAPALLRLLLDTGNRYRQLTQVESVYKLPNLVLDGLSLATCEPSTSNRPSTPSTLY